MLPYHWQSIRPYWDRPLPDKQYAIENRQGLILYCGTYWNKEDGLLAMKACGEFVIFRLFDS
jgi:hypothetical protein